MTMVPYPATTKAVSDVVAGRITAVVDSLSALGGAIQGGQLRALAVTSMTRLHDFPDLPTVAEMFPGLSGNGWFVLAAPAGTPDTVLQKASQDLTAVLEDNDVKAKFAQLGTYSRSAHGQGNRRFHSQPARDLEPGRRSDRTHDAIVGVKQAR